MQHFHITYLIITYMIINYLHACWVIFHAFVDVCLLFSKLTFKKKSFRNIIRISNSFDADHERLSFGTDLAPNCSQRLSADNKIFTEMYSLLGNAVSSVNTMRTLFLLGLPACFPVAGADAGSMV